MLSIMNKSIKIFMIWASAAALAFGLSSCEKNNATMDYGFPVIYMPQATVTGLDNTYPVPGGPINQNTSYNCNVKDGKLNVAVGVMRAGYVAGAKAYSVNLGVSPAETSRKLEEYASKGIAAMALPDGCCSVPARIDVPAGESGATCYVSIDLAALGTHEAEIRTEEGSRLLVLGLEISNPTEYELAKENTSLVMVIDPDSEYWNGTTILPL